MFGIQVSPVNLDYKNILVLENMKMVEESKQLMG